MITYYFGEKDCKLDFNDFLSITTDIKRYKSDFKYFSDLYEFIEKNTNKISNILFDGYEYIIENGKLHNLYGPAYIKYNTTKENPYSFGSTTTWFYINGKLGCDRLDTKGCRKLEDFQNNEIFFYEELSNKKAEVNTQTGKMYRRREGIDYIKHIINLKERIKKDQRKKKLLKINELQRNKQ